MPTVFLMGVLLAASGVHALGLPDAEGAVDSVSSSVSDTTDTVSDAVGDTTSTVTDTVSDAQDTVGSTIDDTVSTVEDTTGLDVPDVPGLTPDTDGATPTEEGEALEDPFLAADGETYPGDTGSRDSGVGGDGLDSEGLGGVSNVPVWVFFVVGGALLAGVGSATSVILYRRSH